MKVMFDTNVFCHLREGKINKTSIPKDWEIVVTHIQRDEILNTINATIKNELNEIFNEIVGLKLPTKSAVWDVSAWDECNWSDDGLYESIKTELDKRKKKTNNQHDALIAETAIKNNLTLITNDQNLKEVAESFSCKVIDLAIPSAI